MIVHVTLVMFLLPSLNCLTIPALGRSVSLGTAYNVRTSEFGVSVLRGEIPGNCIEVIDTPKTSTTTKIIRKVEEKSSLMHLDASVSVDVLSGLVKVEGCGEYLKDKLNSDGFTEITHVTEVFTKKDELKHAL